MEIHIHVKDEKTGVVVNVTCKDPELDEAIKIANKVLKEVSPAEK